MEPTPFPDGNRPAFSNVGAAGPSSKAPTGPPVGGGANFAFDAPAPAGILGARSKRDAALDAARAHIAAGAYPLALGALGPLVNKSRSDPEAMYLAAVCHERTHNIPKAVELARKCLDHAEHPEPILLLARLKRASGATDEAVALCDRALRRAPGHPGAILIQGGALEEAGRYAEARRILAPLIEQARAADRPPDPMLDFEWAKLLVHDRQLDEAVERIDRVVAGSVHAELRRLAGYLKAKACDRKKDYKAAYEAAAAANEIGRLDFSPSLYTEQVSVLIDNWSREKMAKFPISACRSELPVFVAGMPRSGTSLIDQIIDAHPKAAGVGELATIELFAHQLTAAWNPEKEPPASFGRFDSFRWTRAAEAYVKEIKALAAPGVERIVNKSLGNNKLVGLIARLFPKTRIIHAIRDPRDVAVSCFQGGFNNALHPWTTRYEWIARAWEQSMRMMEHWKKSLDVPILDVHYERLVKHPETEFPRIIEFLGLEWDEACTKFHESRRTVRTLSYDQVNKPLYTTSAGRNANYVPFMEGIEFPPYNPG